MKKSSIYIIIILYFIVIALNGCNNVDNVGDSNSKIVKTETKTAINVLTGVELYKVYFKEFDVNSKLKTFIQFNDFGVITSQSDFKYENFEKSEFKITFDSNGLKVKLEHNSYTYSPENGNLLKISKLDSLGNLITVTSYTYDLKGNILNENEVLSGNNTKLSDKKIEYEYNENGSLEGMVVKDLMTNTVISKDSLAYISNTNVLEKYNISTDGTIFKVNKFYYNQSGRLQKEIETDKTGTILKKYIYKYTFF